MEPEPFILRFVAMVLSGLLMGAREFALYGLTNILGQLTLAVSPG